MATPQPPSPAPARFPAPPDPPPGPLTSLSQALVCGVLGTVSWFITDVLNTTVVHHRERFDDAVARRARGQGLITCSNHVTAVDDPGAVRPLVPAGWLASPSRLRWTLCAADRCFTNPVVGGLLSAGRVLPVERGRGPLQPGMDAVVGKLQAGDWLHLFPEGTRQPYGGGVGRLRPGVGRLVADAVPTPLVVPMYHRGLHRLHAKGDALPVSAGHRIDIAVGRPLDFAPRLAAWRATGLPERDIHVAVADEVGAAMAALRVSGGGGGGGGRVGEPERLWRRRARGARPRWHAVCPRALTPTCTAPASAAPSTHPPARSRSWRRTPTWAPRCPCRRPAPPAPAPGSGVRHTHDATTSTAAAGRLARGTSAARRPLKRGAVCTCSAAAPGCLCECVRACGGPVTGLHAERRSRPFETRLLKTRSSWSRAP
jgi:1-acyl-sn-glycerol-3-phosphate acyltransferase